MREKIYWSISGACLFIAVGMLSYGWDPSMFSSFTGMTKKTLDWILISFVLMCLAILARACVTGTDPRPEYQERGTYCAVNDPSPFKG